MTPLILRHNQDDELTVACGKCPPCLRKRIACWSFRLSKQAEVSTSALFVTLTYNNNHVPFSENGLLTLKKTDLQLFFKRLRKRSKQQIKYYACGEYGTRTHRPHYHLIIFNTNEADIIASWTNDGKPLGNIHFRSAEKNSIGYTLKYCCKAKKVGKHPLDDRQKEFPLMSKYLGINYITPEMILWHQNDILNRMYCPLKDNKKAPMPRYYKSRIYEPEQLQEISMHIHAKTQEALTDLIAELGEENYIKQRQEKITHAFKKMYDHADKRTS